MKHAAKAFALGLALAMGGVPALASEQGKTLTPEIRAQIIEKLTAEGYEVRKVKTEDGYFEVYALKDGKKLEIYLDDNLEPVKIKGDD